MSEPGTAHLGPRAGLGAPGAPGVPELQVGRRGTPCASEVSEQRLAPRRVRWSWRGAALSGGRAIGRGSGGSSGPDRRPGASGEVACPGTRGQGSGSCPLAALAPESAGASAGRAQALGPPWSHFRSVSLNRAV